LLRLGENVTVKNYFRVARRISRHIITFYGFILDKKIKYQSSKYPEDSERGFPTELLTIPCTFNIDCKLSISMSLLTQIIPFVLQE
jgi:hypothetical protein